MTLQHYLQHGCHRIWVCTCTTFELPNKMQVKFKTQKKLNSFGKDPKLIKSKAHWFSNQGECKVQIPIKIKSELHVNLWSPVSLQVSKKDEWNFNVTVKSTSIQSFKASWMYPHQVYMKVACQIKLNVKFGEI